jgi:Mycothiol maleylpyruvate isomerase N-terminal domain
MMTDAVDREALFIELERVRADIRHLLAIATDDDWDRPSAGTGWTNEQLLFHMLKLIFIGC